MLHALIAATALLAAPPAPAPPDLTTAVQVYWKGKRHRIDALPEEMPEPARAAIGLWAEWAGPVGYRMELEESGRVLLLSASKAQARQRMLLIKQSLELFDRLLPAPEREEAPAEAGAPPVEEEPLPEDPDEIPEDPEEDVPWAGGEEEDPPEKHFEPWTYVWGAGTRPLDTETAVFLAVHDPRDYASCLDFLAGRFPYLGEWVEEARQINGFALEEPLAGALIENAPEMEEWDPENELVHRLATLLLLRRFGRQPYWIQQGWAWHAELEIRGTIYCFPYRAGFVGIGEHGGWRVALRNRFSRRPGEPPTIDEVAGLRRGFWSDPYAQIAWGTITFLLYERRQELPLLLDDMRRFWDENNRVEQDDGLWGRDRFYQIPLPAQREMLVARAGDHIFAELLAWFRAGG